MPATATPPSPSAQRARRRAKLRGFGFEPTALTAGSREGFRPPRPLLGTLILLASLPLPVALWASGVAPAPVALGFGAVFVLVAFVQSGLAAYDLHRSRCLADPLLRAYPGLPPVSGLAAWRAAELTSTRRRRELARLVRRLRLETEACTRSRAPHIDNAALDESLVFLRRLECRLELLSKPVSPVGMLDISALATDDVSPLYFPERAGTLPAALARALAALEPEC